MTIADSLDTRTVVYQAPVKSSQTDVLVLENVSHRFGGVHAVRSVSLKISSGCCVGIIGPNGAGKSTLLALIAGTRNPCSGTILFCNRNITVLPPQERVRLGIHWSYQHPPCFPSLTSLEYLEVSQAHLRQNPSIARATALSMLKSLGLHAYSDRRPRCLPPSERKLLDIARAACGSPGLLLLDEPFAGLSDFQVKDIQNVIEAARSHGAGILVVEHRLAELLPMITEVVLLVDGQVAAAGDVDSVLHGREFAFAYGGIGRA